MDICITAVEKYPNDMEKCTQVRRQNEAAHWGLDSLQHGVHGLTVD